MPHSLLPLSIEPYNYMFGEVKVHGFALMAGDDETEVASTETDEGVEVGSDQAIDNYLQTKADAQLIMTAVNNYYQMVNLLRKIDEWDDYMVRDCNTQSIPFHISMELKSLLNQLDVPNPNIPGEEGNTGENTSTGNIPTLSGI